MTDTSGLADHYNNPRNLGDLAEPDGVALVHNPVCGDMLRLVANCRDGVIVKARFKAYGCAAAIAAGSVASELISGTTIDEAASIKDEDIRSVLGPLPPMKVHAIVLAREGIQNLVEQLRRANDAG